MCAFRILFISFLLSSNKFNVNRGLDTVRIGGIAICNEGLLPIPVLQPLYRQLIHRYTYERQIAIPLVDTKYSERSEVSYGYQWARLLTELDSVIVYRTPKESTRKGLNSIHPNQQS
jgi:hypothetical protein